MAFKITVVERPESDKAAGSACDACGCEGCTCDLCVPGPAHRDVPQVPQSASRAPLSPLED